MCVPLRLWFTHAKLNRVMFNVHVQAKFCCIFYCILTVFSLHQIWYYIVYNVWPKRFDYTARTTATTTTTTANDKRRIGIAFGRDKNGNQKSTSEKSKYGRHRLALSIKQLKATAVKTAAATNVTQQFPLTVCMQIELPRYWEEEKKMSKTVQTG